MRKLVLLLLALAVACAGPAAATEIPRARGFAIGFGSTDAAKGERPGIAASISHWRRLARGTTWDTRLEYQHVPEWRLDAGVLPANTIEGQDRHAASDFVLLDTGLDLHVPATAAVAPFVGLRAGAGWAVWGEKHGPLEEAPWIELTEDRQKGPVATFAVEAGLRVFATAPWPSLRASAGLQEITSFQDHVPLFTIRLSAGY